MQKKAETSQAVTTTAPTKRQGRIVRVMTTVGKGTWEFPTRDADVLAVDLEGIVGNRHRGWTRPADVRVPWIKRGATIRNTRHLSIVSLEDLAVIAGRLDVESIDPNWIGANVLVEGFASWSFMPRGTRLLSVGSACLIVEDQNAPCRIAGKGVQDQVPGRDDIALAFAKAAKGLRGVVASVEHPGELRAGAALEARIPEQWIYG